MAFAWVLLPCVGCTSGSQFCNSHFAAKVSNSPHSRRSPKNLNTSNPAFDPFFAHMVKPRKLPDPEEKIEEAQLSRFLGIVNDPRIQERLAQILVRHILAGEGFQALFKNKCKEACFEIQVSMYFATVILFYLFPPKADTAPNVYVSDFAHTFFSPPDDSSRGAEKCLYGPLDHADESRRTRSEKLGKSR
jgi:hypothetical protein